MTYSAPSLKHNLTDQQWRIVRSVENSPSMDFRPGWPFVPAFCVKSDRNIDAHGRDGLVLRLQAG